MTLTLDPIAGVSLLASINLIYIAGLSFFEARQLATSRLFASLGLVAAWWTFWIGLAFTDLGQQEPRFLQLSQFFSGFFGPLLLLFTLAYTRRPVKFSATTIAILIPGLFGTLSVIGLWALDPPIYRMMASRFLSGEAGFDLSVIHNELLWYELLQRAHTAELLIFNLASIGVFVQWSRHQTRRQDRLDGLLIATIYTTMLIGVLVTNILPGLGFSAIWPRLSPLLTVPFVLLLFRFVHQRARNVERLAHERERLLSYLPVAALERDDENGHGPSGSALAALEQARKADAVVLFADLEGFTSASENLSPEALVTWVDAFFSRMSTTILKEQGMVDKLIGDAVLAIFGVLPPLENPAAAAVRCAMAMQEALARLNEVQPIAPGTIMGMGIGLHHGPLVAGSVGNEARRSYTVFGDTVNTASRLESLTRSLEGKILASAAVVDRLPDDLASLFEDCGTHPIRGRQEALRIHCLRPA